jgi:hypothetical protein
VNAFHVLGALAAIWALLVSFLGITRENFPATAAQERLVGMISALVVFGAIGTAIYTGATEEHESDGDHGEEAALVLPR